MLKDTIYHKTAEKIKKLNENQKGGDEYCATFGDVKQNLVGQEFKGANVDAIFGSVTINLKEAIVNHDQVINANAIFGGIEVIVPTNVNVKIRTTPIFGGVSNKITSSYQENLPTIYLNCFCLFGGVSIK